MEFDLPKALLTHVEPSKIVLNGHYKALYPEYDWKHHSDYIGLVKEACWFYDDIITNKIPRWVSFTGQSGTGKSEWAKRIKLGLKQRGYNVQMWNWATVCDDYLNNGDYGILKHLEKMPILIIDEIGLSDWTTGTKKLTHLLDRRMDKFTICISNLSVSDIANKLDVRIASRMKRGNNRIAVMGNDCPDYDNVRNKQNEQ